MYYNMDYLFFIQTLRPIMVFCFHNESARNLEKFKFEKCMFRKYTKDILASLVFQLFFSEYLCKLQRFWQIKEKK